MFTEILWLLYSVWRPRWSSHGSLCHSDSRIIFQNFLVNIYLHFPLNGTLVFSVLFLPFNRKKKSLVWINLFFQILRWFIYHWSFICSVIKLRKKNLLLILILFFSSHSTRHNAWEVKITCKYPFSGYYLKMSNKGVVFQQTSATLQVFPEYPWDLNALGWLPLPNFYFN